VGFVHTGPGGRGNGHVPSIGGPPETRGPPVRHSYGRPADRSIHCGGIAMAEDPTMATEVLARSLMSPADRG
jgi:hypothetical protein